MFRPQSGSRTCGYRVPEVRAIRGLGIAVVLLILAGGVLAEPGPGVSNRIIALLAARARVETISIAACGDMMFARGVGKLVARYGTDYPFRHVSTIISSADIGFGNLETSLSDRGQPIPGKLIWFRSMPAMARAMADSGFTVVSLANNHILDYDEPALEDTITHLERAGIRHIGAGANLRDARRGAVVDIRGISVAFLAYTEFADIFWCYTYPRRFAAGDRTPGVAPLRASMIIADIRKAKARADHVIVSLHWGVEYSPEPEIWQTEFARRLIDEGASVVLGHHPHVLQPIEAYGPGLIFYSLGNFVFDQRRQDTVESMIALISLSKKGIAGAEIIPCMIQDGRPRPLNSWAAEALLDKVRRMSARRDTALLSQRGRGVVVIPGI